MNLKEKLSKIQTELKAAKGQKNKFGGYQYRSAEDVLEALKPLNAKYDTYVVITETLLSEGVLQSVATVSDTEGESVSANAIVGIDMNQKGMSLPQKYGSASSYAKKYALGNLFAIDNTADADALNTHGSQKTELKKDSEAYKKVVAALTSKVATLSQVETKYVINGALKAELAKL